MRTAPLELSDRDNESLTMHIDHEGVWVTCTSGGDELCVGPLSRTSLLDWITAAQPR